MEGVTLFCQSCQAHQEVDPVPVADGLAWYCTVCERLLEIQSDEDMETIS